MDWLDRIHKLCEKSGLGFPHRLLHAFHTSLKTADWTPLTVLGGVSGTGKSELPRLYARFGGLAFEPLSVQPNWDSPQSLFGFFNSVDNRFNATPLLRALVQSQRAPAENRGLRNHLLLVLLDEMNLSHPEQYLAPVLSAMEIEHGSIDLHSGDADEYGIPSSIHYPDNLVLIGTVNMDETTMGISDKVLDRAFTLEFWDVDVNRWPGWESANLIDDAETVRELLKRVMDVLAPARLHFGWRVIEEVVRFMEQRQAQSAELSVDDALDRVIYAKVLPKLRGDDSPRFRKALAECRTVLNERTLTRSARKVEELIEDVEQTGSFRFWR